MMFPRDKRGHIDLSKVTVEQLIDIGYEYFESSLGHLNHAVSNSKFDIAHNILKDIEAWEYIKGMIVEGGDNFLFKWKEMKDSDGI